MKNTDIDDINNDIITTSDDNYFESLFNSESGIISNRLIEDFKNNMNFLIILVNPTSGPKQGVTVLEYAEKYKMELENYKIISFPVIKKKNKKKSKSENEEEEEKEEKKDILINKISNEFSSLIFNILDEKDLEKAKNFTKKYLSCFPNRKIKILIAGGDGSVVRIIEDLKKEEIPLSQCIFGILPFGTGNDLSNALGFGNDCNISTIENFHNLLLNYYTSISVKVDVWEVEVKLDEEQGNIYDYKDLKKTKMIQFGKSFVNYFSIGFDARLGFIFEQKRTSSRCCNKCVYGCEGFKRFLCCKKNYGMSELFDCFQEEKDEENPKSNKQSEEKITDFSDIEEVKTDSIIKEEKENSPEANRKIIFKTKNSSNISSNIILKGNPISIICQNINYYMGGSLNIWEKSSHLGITPEAPKKNEYNDYKKNIYDNFQKQAFDDKKLEIFVYENLVEQGLEKVKGGTSKRIYQGSGPFYFQFKQNPNNNEKKALENVYLNIDGEFFHIQNPKEISIRLNNNICDGQLNFIKNEKE